MPGFPNDDAFDVLKDLERLLAGDDMHRVLQRLAECCDVAPEELVILPRVTQEC